MRVLIVEDELRLAEALAQLLLEQKYSADTVHNGRDALAYAASGLYDVMILDVMIPEPDGFQVARQIRRDKNPIPILLLTAKDDLADKVKGLDCGADDYMTKPFAPEELMARVRALSRRQGDVILEELSYGDLRLCLDTCVLCSGSRSVHLGFKEFEVLRLLMTRPRLLLSKEELILRVWGADSGAEDNNVEAYISFLRKKFAYLGSQVRIGSVRRVGYRLEDGT